MKVAVTGGTGFVGGHLVDALRQRGDEVWIISRSKGKSESRSDVHRVTWSEIAVSPSRLDGIDAIVNLAGESINQRWTEAAKTRILQSRLDAASRIEHLVASLNVKPDVVVNASGISIYGMSRSDTFDESSPWNISDFLSSVVEKWEAAADRINVFRLVKLRVGLVLGKGGGAFPLMSLPYKLFAGGKVGSGKQWMPWLHIEDMVRLILFCIDNPNLEGPVNACAPHPVTNDAFGRALGRALGRPHWFPVPAFILKTVLGELSLLLLEGQRAVPRKAMEHGFTFSYPTIESAMAPLVGSHK
ncbi:TIGR01777 family oxidoreductase [Paenibacillus solisilvae]|uniref:TIGR01777 family oxidoreductase n=1 Tax=Paenibacillus solisilvae TaxID=2486751 RepID=A0ABW0VTM4_9BACL